MRIYWFVTKHKLGINQKKLTPLLRLEKLGIILGGAFLLINLLGFTVFTFENTFFQFIGFVLVILGCTEAVIARYTLGNNWTESYEYRIKEKHRLIKTGIYGIVRHPIYGGLLTASVGAFIVAQTFLFIPVFLILIILMTQFAKREERLLESHFGKEFLSYKQKTKRFIPGLL